MDKKPKTSKNSLRQHSTYFPQKQKKLRTITGRTAKALENTAEQKYAHLSKFKKLPLNTKRQAHRSALPFDSPIPMRDSSKQQLKLYQSNISSGDLPISCSQKTIKLLKSNEKPKGNNKLVKQKRKTKWFKEQKKQEQKERSSQKYQPTIRKVTYVQDDYQILYKKTQKILSQYKQRQNQWEQEKETLLQELQDLRRKSMGMALTSCSSYSLNRRNMF